MCVRTVPGWRLHLILALHGKGAFPQIADKIKFCASRKWGKIRRSCSFSEDQGIGSTEPTDSSDNFTRQRGQNRLYLTAQNSEWIYSCTDWFRNHRTSWGSRSLSPLGSAGDVRRVQLSVKPCPSPSHRLSRFTPRSDRDQTERTGILDNPISGYIYWNTHSGPRVTGNPSTIHERGTCSDSGHRRPFFSSAIRHHFAN